MKTSTKLLCVAGIAMFTIFAGVVMLTEQNYWGVIPCVIGGSLWLKVVYA